MVTRVFLLVCLAFAKSLSAQTGDCTFKPPFYKMHFGAGEVQDVNTTALALYNRVSSSCPTDGHYTFTSYTSDCFRGDWHTITEDHTPGDAGGNMLVVNSAYNTGTFFTAKVSGFKSQTVYQFGVWLMNVCRPSDKCPFPLLPNLTIRLQTLSGRTVAQFATGEIPRRETPYWTQHRAQFTVPASETQLLVTMYNNAPGGCGNDFAMDDITFQECIKPTPAKLVEIKKVPAVAQKKEVTVSKQEVKKKEVAQTPVSKPIPAAIPAKNKSEITVETKPTRNQQTLAITPVPLVLKQRTNQLAKRIETEEAELVIDLYDNGEIDGDTVSIYHNNRLIVSEQRLSQKPI